MDLNNALRPLERRVVQLVDQGIGTNEIARRFRRSPEMINRIIAMAALPGLATEAGARAPVLRPLERRVVSAEYVRPWDFDRGRYGRVGAARRLKLALNTYETVLHNACFKVKKALSE